MVHRIDWGSAKDPRQAVHSVVEQLAEGRLVVFPTETGYATAARAEDADAVDALERTFAGENDVSFVLAPSRPSDVLKYVKRLSIIGRRLAERCWPGPVTLQFPHENTGASFHSLPENTRNLVATDAGFSLRIPAHASVQEALRILASPLVFAGAHRAQNGAAFGPSLDAVNAVLDDGPPKFAGRPTVVRVLNGSFEVVETGVVTPGRLQRLANEMIVFVCSGNTCRSPMAEALAKHMLAKALAVDVDRLSEAGYTIVSAGVAAASGAPASDHARDVVRDYAADLDDHVAQRLTPQLAFAADRIVVMTREHQEIISRLWPSVASRVQRLGGEKDVVDPYGGAREDYDVTVRAIAAEVERFVGELVSRRQSEAGKTERA